MAKPSKDGKTLVQFNVKDAVYSVEGETASVKPLTYMNTFTKDRNISVKNIYGDGELQDSLYSDKSITGAIGTTARDMDFEKDIGLVENIDSGGTCGHIGGTGEFRIPDRIQRERTTRKSKEGMAFERTDHCAKRKPDAESGRYYRKHIRLQLHGLRREFEEF